MKVHGNLGELDSFVYYNNEELLIAQSLYNYTKYVITLIIYELLSTFNTKKANQFLALTVQTDYNRGNSFPEGNF